MSGISSSSALAQADSTKGNDPSALGLEQARAKDKWRLCQALMHGQEGMNNRTMLPPFDNEPEKSYIERAGMTKLTNVYRRSVARLSATPFSKPIVFDPDADDRIVGNAETSGWKSDVDGQGTDIDTFARDLLQDALVHGYCYIFPNYQAGLPDEMTLRDKKALGIRPYLQRISPEDLIGAKIEIVNGRIFISELRWRETVKERVGEFGEREVSQIRITRLDEVITRQKKQNGSGEKPEWEEVARRAVSPPPAMAAGGLPLVFMKANMEGGPITASPPMADLAELNHKHFMSDSDMQRIIHVTCMPFLQAKGYTEQELGSGQIGATTIARTASTEPGAGMSWVEHSGQQIAALQANLEVIKRDMDAVSMRMLLKNKSGDITATETAVTTAEETSELQEMTGNLATALDAAWRHALAWDGDADAYDAQVGTTINADFGIIMRGEGDIKALIDLHVKEIISHHTLLGQLRQRGLLSENLDVAAEIEKVKVEIEQRESRRFANAS